MDKEWIVQWKLNSRYTMQFATEFELCFLGNRQPSLQVSIRVSGWQSGSRPRRFEGLKQRGQEN